MNRFYFLVAISVFTLGFFEPGCGDSSPPEDTGTDTDTDTNTDTETSPWDISVVLSEKIGTVGIVEWSVDFTSTESAHIDFGLTTDYGMVAPVDLEEPNYRTLLLGMKASRKYHFKIVVSDGINTLESEDQIVETGPISNHLPTFTIDTADSTQLAGGFILSCFYLDAMVFITDADGDFVWWTNLTTPPCGRARMTHDGKKMVVRDVNVHMSDGDVVVINMDGQIEGLTEMVESHHDFVILPDETYAMIYYDELDPVCDKIVEVAPDGTETEIFSLRDVITPPIVENGDGCHSNSLHYHPEDDTYTISVLNTNQYIKVTRSGELVWILGGVESTFDVPAWYRQHGHDMLDNGNILFFNNRDPGLNESALIKEFALDLDTWQATEVWEYDSGYDSAIYGDVERLPNGNTLVTYSASGVIHELNPSGELVRETIYDQGGGVVYAQWRDSLYGPPPGY